MRIFILLLLFWKFYYSWLIFNGTLPGKYQPATVVKRSGIIEVFFKLAMFEFGLNLMFGMCRKIG